MLTISEQVHMAIPENFRDRYPDLTKADAGAVVKFLRNGMQKAREDWSVRLVSGACRVDVAKSVIQHHPWIEIYIPETQQWYLVDLLVWRYSEPVDEVHEIRLTDWKEEHLDRFYMRTSATLVKDIPKPGDEAFDQTELRELKLEPELWDHAVKSIPQLASRQGPKLRLVETRWLALAGLSVFGNYHNTFKFFEALRRVSEFDFRTALPANVEPYLQNMRRVNHNVACPPNV